MSDSTQGRAERRRFGAEHISAIAAVISAMAAAVIGYLSISAVTDAATDSVAAEREALLRTDRVAAYTTYVENLERHRLLLLNNVWLSSRDHPDGTAFYRVANQLIPEIAADEKRVRLLGSPATVEAMEAVKTSRLEMYNQFVCNAGLQSRCDEIPRVASDETQANLDASRKRVDDALNGFVRVAKLDVNGSESPAPE